MIQRTNTSPSPHPISEILFILLLPTQIALWITQGNLHARIVKTSEITVIFAQNVVQLIQEEDRYLCYGWRAFMSLISMALPVVTNLQQECGMKRGGQTNCVDGGEVRVVVETLLF